MNTSTAYHYTTPQSRWRGVGPYYAMFPTSFADAVISDYTKKTQIVFDPFAGRGTAVYSAAEAGRIGIGIEVSPLGWVYGATKLFPASRNNVEQRLFDVARRAGYYSRSAEKQPSFFHHCFSRSVLEFLLSARANLKWRESRVDRTLTALLLIYLHGKEGSALSNQMHQAKSMSPQYCIDWWRTNGYSPPKIDILEFMLRRIRWRYDKDTVLYTNSRMYLGKCESLTSRALRGRSISLLLTSPPYLGVTDYHYDQWLRLWLLGGDPLPRQAVTKSQGKSRNVNVYTELLKNAFTSASEFLTRSSVVYVRTSARESTLYPTITVLETVFPKKKISIRERPAKSNTQTTLYAKEHVSMDEVDLVLI